jgi:hypothetical protein
MNIGALLQWMGSWFPPSLGKVTNYLTGGFEKWWLKSVEPVV